MMPSSDVLDYEGSNFLRLRLALSALSGRPVKIRRIRSRAENPGLNESEASLVRLLDKITNGSRFEVSETGTSLTFYPGMLIGGKIDHDCSLERGVGYYLEFLILLGAFCKDPLLVRLKGVTNNQLDPSADLLKFSAIPVLKKFFMVDDGLELNIVKRGAAPKGGGEVVFKCPVMRMLKPQQSVDQGKIKRIRGVAWATRVSPAVANRIIESAKGALLNFIPDVYIYADHCTGMKSGKSPGFGLTLTAETTSGICLSSEVTCEPPSTKEEKREPSVPEDIGVGGAHALLEEIYRGGCVDSTCQSLFLLLMTLGPKDVSKVVTGPLSGYTVHFLRHLKDFFETVFKLETFVPEDGDDEQLKMGADKVLATCVGVGYTNLGKRTT